jgi:hypothetical protein
VLLRSQRRSLPRGLRGPSGSEALSLRPLLTSPTPSLVILPRHGSAARSTARPARRSEPSRGDFSNAFLIPKVETPRRERCASFRCDGLRLRWRQRIDRLRPETYLREMRKPNRRRFLECWVMCRWSTGLPVTTACRSSRHWRKCARSGAGTRRATSRAPRALPGTRCSGACLGTRSTARPLTPAQ